MLFVITVDLVPTVLTFFFYLNQEVIISCMLPFFFVFEIVCHLSDANVFPTLNLDDHIKHNARTVL